MNVIHIDQGTWYCMRQCRESVKHLKTLRNPIYDIEIKGEQDMYDHFMDKVLNRAA